MQVRIFLNLCYKNSANLINYKINVKYIDIIKNKKNKNIVCLNNRYINSKHIKHIEFIHYNYINKIQLNNNKIRGTKLEYKKQKNLDIDQLVNELKRIEFLENKGDL